MSMRRIFLLMAVAAMMLVLATSPALAQGAEPTGSNCYGSNQSKNVAGESAGDLPGSKVDPAGGFTDPRDNVSPTWNGPVTSFFGNPQLAPGEESPSVLTDFQLDNRDLSAGTSPVDGTCPQL